VRTFDRRKPFLDDVRNRGIRAVKLRVKDPARADDVTILRQVRREVGDGFVIGVDANQGWPVSLIDPTPVWDLEYATAFGRECDDLGIAWIEEPLDMHDWDGMAKLRSAVKTPIAGAELTSGRHEVLPFFEHECLDIYQPDTTFSGFTDARFVMDQCRKRDLRYTPHTWTCGVGLLINLHAAAAWNRGELLEYPYEPGSWVPEARDGIIPPILPGPDGALAVPQEPGLGIHVDDRRLARFGRRFYTATPLRIAVRVVREKGLRAALELKRKKRGK
jgi:L-alanine-DL-glutamate epimerase-like enolase superfamily enzyme